MTPRPSSSEIKQWNAELRSRTPLEITRWAVQHGAGQAIVSTNFRPYEAAILHAATQVEPDIRVLWVDHGYNRPATYRHAEELRATLKLNLRAFLPRVTVAHREALHGPVPDPQDEVAMKAFSAQMKLEPFQRGMRELAPTVWLTALRRDQTVNRAALDLVAWDESFQTLKVSPFFYWNDEQLEVYLREHALPNEFDYYDPAKGDQKRECGLHAAWGRQALAGADAEAARR